MIITEKIRKVTICNSENPLKDLFDDIGIRRAKYKISNDLPVYFIRYIGSDHSENYKSKIHEIEETLRTTAAAWNLCIDSLDKSVNQQEMEQATKLWDILQPWYDGSSNAEADLYALPLVFDQETVSLEQKRTLIHTLRLYDQVEQHRNGTMRKNLLTLLLVWKKRYLTSLVQQGGAISKLIHYGPLKRNEAYFLIYASQSGFDVLHINPEEDDELSRIDGLQRFSKQIRLQNQTRVTEFGMPFSTSFLDFSRKKQFAEAKADPQQIDHTQIDTIKTPKEGSYATKILATGGNGEEPVVKSYEELAAISSSIVMINIYKHDFFPAGNGSGVAIDNHGLILTNYHVVREGGIFGVVFENDEREYVTHSLVAFNSENDLALLRIERVTIPVPFLSQGNLKRGQQIVAIGSPLGLMNTISDGIIAGFRRINEIEYIQITAPISPGSSGGALLDRSGRLIGITTAGFSDGQNLNLAVPISELAKLSIS